MPDWNFLEGVTLNVAVAHGLSNAQRVIAADQVRPEAVSLRRGDDLSGRLHRRRRPAAVHRQLASARPASPPSIAKTKARSLRKSHENPDVARLYEEFLGKPLGERSHHLLHTKYTPRERT